MKKIISVAVGFLTCGILFAQNMDAKSIMKKNNDVEEASSSSYMASLLITNKKGSVRNREIIVRSFKEDGITKSVMCFTTPKDVAGVSYLSFEYEEIGDKPKKNSDSWLYMPAMKKTRRIADSGKDEDFMGTDFTYDDIDKRGINKDDFELLGEESVAGKDCYKIQAISKDKTEKNPRRIYWIDRNNFMMVKAQYYDRQDMLHRELACENTEKVDGFWITKKMIMKNVQTNHSTVYEIKDPKMNVAIDRNLFTVTAIEKGLVR